MSCIPQNWNSRAKIKALDYRLAVCVAHSTAVIDGLSCNGTFFITGSERERERESKRERESERERESLLIIQT